MEQSDEQGKRLTMEQQMEKWEWGIRPEETTRTNNQKSKIKKKTLTSVS